MPVYNGAGHIREALDALLAQTFTDFELIISDNTSTDGTWEICHEYAARDSRIVLHRQSENIGAVANFRFVLDQARAECFMWAAYDDLWMPNLLEELAANLENDPGCALSCYRTEKIGPDGAALSAEVFPDLNGLTAAEKLRALVSAAERGTWFYGLYRTSVLRPAWEEASSYGLVWGSDYLMVLMFVFNDQVTGTNRTTFYQRITGVSEGAYAPCGTLGNLSFLCTMLSRCRSIMMRSRLKRERMVSTRALLAVYLRCAAYFARLFLSRTRMRNVLMGLAGRRRGCSR